jgi:alkanesulfonate monooxygenase SsuD/methylene tetrahydromethanopterin reductase-like flavin-dependent oxidoreductase (luciferase family)
VVQQALVVAALAPGRLRLGVGPSHRATMEGTFGIRFERPLEHLREYVAVLRAALQGGPFDFDGKRFRVRGEVPNPPGVPVLASALGPGAFQLAGEVADGALPFICPLDYLRDQALPALRAGAAQAGRPAPGIYAHCFAAVHRDRGAVHAAAREAIGGMLNAPFYQRMFVQAGFAEAAAGELSERIVDAVVVHGDEAAVAQRLRAHLDAGMEEVVVSPLVVGGDRDAETERVLRLAAAL